MSASLRLVVALSVIACLIAVVAGSARASTNTGPVLVSNVMKAKHDTAKNSISNVR